MTEMENKMLVCDLLDSLRDSVQWMNSIETIFNAVGITCRAIQPDPLFEFNMHLLLCYFHDTDLLEWWLAAEEEDELYIDPHTGEEFEILDASDLYELDQKRRKR